MNVKIDRATPAAVNTTKLLNQRNKTAAALQQQRLQLRTIKELEAYKPGLKTGLSETNNRPCIEETTQPEREAANRSAGGGEADQSEDGGLDSADQSEMPIPNSLSGNLTVERKRWDRSIANTRFKGQSSMEIDEEAQRSALFTDLLECQICHQSFTDPRILPCGHTFCKKCIENWHQKAGKEGGRPVHRLRCPVCNKYLTLTGKGVDNLSIDFKVTKLRDILKSISVVEKPADGKVSCDVCTLAKRTSAAGHYCMQCNKNLCEACETRHRGAQVFTGHTVVENSLVLGTLLCREHAGEQIKYFCKDCSSVLCTICTLASEHAEHAQCALQDGMDTYREEVAAMATKLEAALAELHTQQEVMSRRCGLVKDTYSTTAERIQNRTEQLEIHLQQARGELTEGLQDAHKKLSAYFAGTAAQTRFKNPACARLFSTARRHYDAQMTGCEGRVTEEAAELGKQLKLQSEGLLEQVEQSRAAQTLLCSHAEDELELRLTVCDSLLQSARDLARDDSAIQLLAKHDDLLQRGHALLQLQQTPVELRVTMTTLTSPAEEHARDDEDKDKDESEAGAGDKEAAAADDVIVNTHAVEVEEGDLRLGALREVSLEEYEAELEAAQVGEEDQEVAVPEQLQLLQGDTQKDSCCVVL